MNSSPPKPPAENPVPDTPILDVFVFILVAAVAAIAVRGLDTGEYPYPPRTRAAVDLCRSVDDGYLSGALYGAIEQRIEWRGTDMACDGGTRPDNAGIRVVFSGNPTAATERLVMVIGIDGAIEDIAATERMANITVIDESTGRFFSSGRQERCWTTVNNVEGDGPNYRVSGELYCSGSLPSVSNSGSVTLRGFRYSGRLSIDAS